jgi:hypothetical protein
MERAQDAPASNEKIGSRRVDLRSQASRLEARQNQWAWPLARSSCSYPHARDCPSRQRRAMQFDISITCWLKDMNESETREEATVTPVIDCIPDSVSR